MTSERKALSSVELYNVICSIYDMEIQQYMIRLTLKGLDDKINLLPKPQYRSKPKFSYPSAINIMLTIIIMAVCAVIGFIYGTFSDFAGGDENLLLNILIPIPGLICAIMAALAGCVLAIPANIVCVVITIPKAKKAYQKNLERYEINVVEQEKENKKILAQKEILLRERKDLCSRYEKADDELRQLYLKSGIDESFCNAVSIAIMLRLMKLEICTHLTGPDGLYAMLRNEYKQLYVMSRLDDISEKLDQINDKLDHIASDISFLLSDMQEMRQTSQAILNQIINHSC